MHRGNRKYIGKSNKYKGVSQVYFNDLIQWKAKSYANYTYWEKFCETERDAALAYDMYMIKIGKNPVNVLKPKSQV